MKTKFPKQWRHWAQCAGLKPDDRATHGNYYMTGRNRRWRVDALGIFECSCPNQFFDRWANSAGAEVPTIPKTKKEFFSNGEILN